MSIREALESLYVGECTVYGFEDVVEDGITRQETRVIYTGKCRLSYNIKYGSSREGTQTSTFDKAEQRIRLFLNNDCEIPPGSRVVVNQNGVETQYRTSGRASVYTYHQEITLLSEDIYS
ncbi:MAG: hypothetical protein IJR59_03650 [Firmicutes bacterium]|nr:hypothetical protein [Bacillota bacterium]